MIKNGQPARGSTALWMARRAVLAGGVAGGVLLGSWAGPPDHPSSDTVELAGFCILGHHHHARGCRGGSLVKGGDDPFGSACDNLASATLPDGVEPDRSTSVGPNPAPSYALVECSEPLDSPREPGEMIQDGVELKENEANSESFPMPGRLVNPAEIPLP